MERELTSVLEWWAASGVEVPDIPAPRRTPPPAQKTASPDTTLPPVKKREKPKAKLSGDPAELAAGASTLAELKAVLDTFEAGALTDGARQAVFSRGNPDAKIMILGEAPGRDEDIHGKPFIGKSGQLLDRMMAAIGLDETGFYVTNVIHWRPDKNRTPTAAEIDMCTPFLMRHIELQQPDVILMTGNVPLRAMTGQTGIMRQRGQWRDVEVAGRNIAALPIYHPAFLLRQPALKRDAWRDLLSLRQRLDDAQT